MILAHKWAGKYFLTIYEGTEAARPIIGFSEEVKKFFQRYSHKFLETLVSATKYFSSCCWKHSRSKGS
jgi:hypothetical protein